MPEFTDVAKHFDDVTAYDGYTGLAVFKGQFNTHDETSISGSTERKRSMSVAPGTSIPARRVVQVFDERYIVGDGNTDGIFDRATRKAYWLKRSDTLAVVRTPGELLSGALGVSMYVNKEYMKDTVNVNTDAEYDPFWRINASISEAVLKGAFISVSGLLLRVRTSHVELAGFVEAQSDELDSGALQSVTVAGASTYNPVTDTYTSTPTTVPAIVLDAYKAYKYQTWADVKVNAGDLVFVMSAAAPVGQNITMGSRSYRVLSVRQELDAYAHHVARL